MQSPRLPLPPWLEFLRRESSAGFVLVIAAVLALVVANSSLAPTYFAVLHTKVGGLSILHWINDGLMAGFFLLVGLEIKREMLEGELSTWPRRVLPGIAAVGGMAAPAVLYAFFAHEDGEALRGWAIPMATDIAFALAVIELLGKRVPASLKVFLVALAIIDDLGAVIVIALFYTEQLSYAALGGAALVLGMLIALNRAGVTRLSVYLLLGVALWVLVLKSGVHATLAGVMLALTIPMRGDARPAAEVERSATPLHQLEHALHPWIAFLVLRVFGFANAGVSFSGMSVKTLLEVVPLGIVAGLFVGKQIGVFGFAWAAVKSGIAQRPEGASWLQIYGVSLLCGIGFTMSLFIGGLAFGDSGPLISETKLGVLVASVLSALVGLAVLWFASRRNGAVAG